MTQAFTVREAAGSADIDSARRLVLAHAEERSTVPGVEHIRADAARLPGPYIPPRGAIWIAVAGEEVVGCVALRPLPGGVGEVKRLFVDPAWRAKGVARVMLTRLIDSARERGYHHLRLGTLAEMVEAQALYRSLGFVPIERYRNDEVIDTRFYELALGPD